MVVVSREFPHQVAKYQRYERSRSRVHAYLPECIDVTEGDEITIAECRPLAEVRHDRGRTSVNSFKISSGSREVYTTFAIEFEPLGEAQIELLQK